MKKEKKKKGLSKHHISYDPELVIETSKGGHMVLTGFQKMKPTKENIKEIKDFMKAVQFILWLKEK